MSISHPFCRLLDSVALGEGPSRPPLPSPLLEKTKAENIKMGRRQENIREQPKSTGACKLNNTLRIKTNSITINKILLLS